MTKRKLANDCAKLLTDYKKTNDVSYLNTASQMYADLVKDETFENAKDIMLSFVRLPDTAKMCRKYVPMFLQ